jgi:hypothetical protein
VRTTGDGTGSTTRRRRRVVSRCGWSRLRPR